MRYILDADATIDHLAQYLNLLTGLPDLRPRDLAVCAVTLIELYTGVDGSAEPHQAERDLRRFLRYVTVIPLNQRVIRASSRLRVRLLNQHAEIRRRPFDVIVAATALEYGLIVVSSNTRDYQDVIGLQHFNPRTGLLATY